jgi:hypothetical protein
MLSVLLVALAAAQPAPEPDASRWLASVEYVNWWIRRGFAPAMVTTSSPASQGILDRPDTRVLYGDYRLETRHGDSFAGTRFAVEWQSAGGSFGVEGRAFFLERDSTYTKLRYQSDQLWALSYIDAATGREASEVFAGPDPKRGTLQGGFVGYSRIEWFGQEVNAVLPLLEDETWSLDLLAGLRFFQMRDRFNETATSYLLPEKSHLFSVVDNIRTGNSFYGGQLGLRGEARWGRAYVQARAAIALGGDDQLVRTWGQRIDHTPQRRLVIDHGLYVQQGNTGSFSRGHFDAAGEIAINVGWEFTAWLRGYVGYTFLYWADPLRAAKQIDRVVNLAQPATRPGVPFAGDALWAQGVNVGLETRW